MNYGFYVKCRPQGADAQQIALRHKCAFIGYPAWKNGAGYDRHAMRNCLVDISVPDSEWKLRELRSDLGRSYQREIVANRNFVRETSVGDYLVLPRPGEGVCYIGRVDSPFEIVNDPLWADEYLDLRVQQNLGERVRVRGLNEYRGVVEQEDESSHIADVVQCWHVERWVRIAFPLLPRWISFSVLSRSTKGWLCDRPDGQRIAFKVLDDIYNGSYSPDFEPTSDPAIVAGRMLDWLSPDAFEHLVCEMLQFEQLTLRWWHIGGSGDGGADALAVNDRGQVVAALQCKWKYSGDVNDLATELRERLSSQWGDMALAYVAVLYDTLPASSPAGVTYLDRRALANLVLKHASRSGMAQTLRVAP
jgi:restriction endonuclease